VQFAEKSSILHQQFTENKQNDGSQLLLSRRSQGGWQREVERQKKSGLDWQGKNLLKISIKSV
jgi:hypothetical protein